MLFLNVLKSPSLLVYSISANLLFNHYPELPLRMNFISACFRLVVWTVYKGLNLGKQATFLPTSVAHDYYSTMSVEIIVLGCTK